MKISIFFNICLLALNVTNAFAQQVIPIGGAKNDPFHQFKTGDEQHESDADERLMWYCPELTPGTVGQFEKLEIGVSLDSIVTDHILNYAFKRDGQYVNPFNPNEIDVYAEFWLQQEGVWYGPIRANGFYYQDYNRTTKGWALHPSNDLFRIRFAPTYLGLWRCKISAKIANQEPVSFDEFTFQTVPSQNKGFVRVGDNKRYLRVGEDPFFPVGQNLTGPNNPSHTLEWGSKTAAPSDYIAFQASMTALANGGGNYFRYIVSPWQTEIEFEHLGNYSDRMTNAWEFDQILEHAADLDLKLHLDLAMHYSFEAPNGYAMTDWDWSAKGDDLNPANSPCFKENDHGYCYRNELGLEDPLDFLTDSLAMVFYKRRLRYMVARWGYSTNIGVMELMSEANNFGTETLIELKVINGNYGCYNVPDSANVADAPYKDFPEIIIPKLMAWQLEMCRYLKEDLGLLNHPVAVSCAGEPDFFHGDSTFYSPHVDIATFNNYGVSINKFEKNYYMISQKFQATKSDFYLDKPFMHSEYGPGGTITDCDQGVRYIQTINLTPFTGLAGSGMNWHYHWNENEMWNYLGPITKLLDSIPLDAENWQAGEPMISKNKAIEVMYLYRPKLDGYSKAVGVISNRTYNYYTGGIDLEDVDCKGDTLRKDFVETPLYKTATDFTYEELDKTIKLAGMGSSNVYWIEWFNAMSGDFIEEATIESNMWGRVELGFPAILSGDNKSPLLFFRISPEGESIYSTPGIISVVPAPAAALKVAIQLPSIKLTPWY